MAINEQQREDETRRNCRLFAEHLMDSPREVTMPYHDITNPYVQKMLIDVYNEILTFIEDGELGYIEPARKMMQLYQLPGEFTPQLNGAINQGRKNLTNRIVTDLELGDLEFTLCKDHGFFHGDGDLKERIDLALQEAIRYNLELDGIKTAVQRGLQQNSARVYGLIPQFSEINFLKQRIEYVQ